jgi:hypothetical protein
MYKYLRRKYAHWRGRRHLPADLAAGDVCSILTGDGTFSIAKVLAREPGIVHVRLYKEKFGWRPERVDTGSLSLGGIHDEDGFGIGHLPLVEGEFGSWEPLIIGREAVQEEELEGYYTWKESGGGAWP